MGKIVFGQTSVPLTVDIVDERRQELAYNLLHHMIENGASVTVDGKELAPDAEQLWLVRDSERIKPGPDVEFDAPSDEKRYSTACMSNNGVIVYNGCPVTVDSYSWAEYYGDLSHHELAVDMHECIVMIRNAKGDVQLNAASRLRGHLVYCTTLTDLDELTAVYRDKEEDNAIGYNPPAVADFVGKMLDKYPKSDSINERSLTHWHRIYAETGAVMADCLVTMREFENEPDNAEHKSAAELLHMHLDRCLDWNGIANLTLLYYDKAEDSVVGHNMDAVTEFVSSLTGMYPMPDK